MTPRPGDEFSAISARFVESMIPQSEAQRRLALRESEAQYRRIAERTNRARERRNAEVRDAAAAGMTHAQIAEVTGLTRARVGQIALGGRGG